MSQLPLRPKQKSTTTLTPLRMVAVLGEMGFLIAIPLVVLLILGIKADRYLSTTPLFILLGVGLSIASTTWHIYQLIKRLSVE